MSRKDSGSLWYKAFVTGEQTFSIMATSSCFRVCFVEQEREEREEIDGENGNCSV